MLKYIERVNKNIKKGLRVAKKDYNSTINICKIIINNKVIGKKEKIT